MKMNFQTYCATPFFILALLCFSASAIGIFTVVKYSERVYVSLDWDNTPFSAISKQIDPLNGSGPILVYDRPIKPFSRAHQRTELGVQRQDFFLRNDSTWRRLRMDADFLFDEVFTGDSADTQHFVVFVAGETVFLKSIRQDGIDYTVLIGSQSQSMIVTREPSSAADNE